MLTPVGQFHIFVYTKTFDFRCGIDRIASTCQAELAMNPYGGAVFLFFNRSRDRARVFFCDSTGACLFFKRLNQGRFQMPPPPPGATHALIASSELALLLEGVDVAKIPKPKVSRAVKRMPKQKPFQPLASEAPPEP
jgi:transposase